MGDPVDEFVLFSGSPDPQLVAHYYKRRARKAKSKGDTRADWNFVELHADAALSAIEDNDLMSACTHFFNLGGCVTSLYRLSADHVKEALNLAKSEALRERPFVEKRTRLQHTRELAESIAQKEWEADTEDEIRITEMSRIVWSQLVDICDRNDWFILPENEDRVKLLIRSVAPEYAQKGGRPKKKP